MTKHKLKAQALGIASILALLASLVAPLATQAAQITSRKVTLGSSAPSASTSYTLSTDALPTGTAVQSLALEACTTASGACTTPSGFTSVGSATTGVTTGLGTNTGWTNNTAAAGSLRITQTNAVAPSGVVSVPWTAVTNPSTVNATFFLRMTTYSDTAWVTPIDTGVIAVSTSQTITVTASVDETLSFCTGTSGIYGVSCASPAGTTVALGTLTPAAAGSGVSEIGIATNAASGYAITYLGATLTSGANTITANGATAAASSPGTEQFGINLVANTTPSVGSAPTGTGFTVGAQYFIADSFAFVAGATTSIVTNGSPQAFASFRVSHVANVASTTQPGSYQTTINYVATPTF